MVSFISNGIIHVGTIRKKMESLPYYLIESEGKRYLVLPDEITSYTDESSTSHIDGSFCIDESLQIGESSNCHTDKSLQIGESLHTDESLRIGGETYEGRKDDPSRQDGKEKKTRGRPRKTPNMGRKPNHEDNPKQKEIQQKER